MVTDALVPGIQESPHARGPAWKSLPGSADEARAMVAYHERIVASSASRNRQQRSERSLEWLRPLLESLERADAAKREEADRLQRIEAASPPVQSFDGRLQQWRDTRDDEPELEVSWNGTMGHDGKSITDNDGLGSQLAGHQMTLHRSH